MMSRVISICLFVLCFVGWSVQVDGAPQKKRDINKIKQEQQAAKKEIAETSKKITENTKNTNRMLSKLNSLNAEVAEQQAEVDKIQLSIDSLDRDISYLDDSISSLNGRMTNLKSKYAKSLRSMQGHFHKMNTLSFIFSSESFSKAWQRMRYMQQMSRWRKQRSREIKSVSDSLVRTKTEMNLLQTERRKSIAQLELSQKTLEAQKAETDKLVAELKKEGNSLKALLKEKEKTAKALDRELDRLIAEEQRKAEQERLAAEKKRKEEEKKKAANKSSNTSSTSTTNQKTNSPAVNVADAERALTGNFESNKGRLLFPVSGKYRIVRGFGRQKHPELEHVETENSGIDIEAIGGGNARAVYTGKVSEIFQQPGYNTIVMIRHGSYLTIYANLSSINVKKGDEVKTGEVIGSIYADPEENGASILHFELRKERNKLNPTEWVK